MLAMRRDAREQRLTLDELRASGEVYVTGSLGGAERVVALDGSALDTAAAESPA